jgi:rare lipoprotein A
MPRSVILLAAVVVLATPVYAQQPTQQGEASYFNRGQDGHTVTKSGKPVEPDQNTAASRDLPLGSQARVTNERTGQSTDVEITDRGPVRQDRVIDLSRKAAEDIGMSKSGTAPVTVKPKE